MTDKELLELAAKAAGLELDKFSYTNRADLAQNSFTAKNYIGRWNPLTDDGDALRLAVTLGMSLEVHHDMTQPKPWLRVVYADDCWIHVMIKEYEQDPCAATRRAIVRAAAEIGKGMK